MSASPPGWYLGIDAGGTTTRSALLDASGAVLARGAAGAANHRTSALEAVRVSVRDVIAGVVERFHEAIAAPGGRIRVRGLAIGWSGLEEQGDDAMAAEIGADAVDADLTLVDSDVMAAHVGAFAGGPGVLVAAGTGSIALAVDACGRRTRVGGWGHRFGDEGSAAWIGTEGIRAALRTVDGRGPSSALWLELLEHVGAGGDVADAVVTSRRVTAWMYDPVRHVNDVAAFATRVDRAALAGDASALAVLHAAGSELARHVVRAAAAFAASEPPYVAGVGGVWTGSATVRRACRAAVDDALGPAALSWHTPLADAAVGAAWMAMLADGWKAEPPLAAATTDGDRTASAP